MVYLGYANSKGENREVLSIRIPQDHTLAPFSRETL